MSDQTLLWKRLRLKADTANDTDWRGSGVSPNRVTVTVGGTATSGAYSFRIHGFVTTRKGVHMPVDTTVSFTRTSETNAQIVTGLGAAEDALEVPLSKFDIVATFSTTTFTLDFPPDAQLEVELTAPSPGTMTADKELPQLGSAPHFGGSRYYLGQVAVTVHAVDSSGDQLNPGTGTQTTFDLEVVEIQLVRRMTDTGVEVTEHYSRTSTQVDATLNTIYEFPLRGAGFFTVRLTNFADAVASTAGYEVLIRDQGPS